MSNASAAFIIPFTLIVCCFIVWVGNVYQKPPMPIPVPCRDVLVVLAPGIYDEARLCPHSQQYALVTNGASVRCVCPKPLNIGPDPDAREPFDPFGPRPEDKPVEVNDAGGADSQACPHATPEGRAALTL